MLELGLKFIPIQSISGVYKLPVCSKKVWENIQNCKSDADISKAFGALGVSVSDIPLKERAFVLYAYIDSVKKLREDTGLEVPYYPSKKNDDDIKYTIYTGLDKLVADYANLSVYAVDDLPIFDYWLLLRDAFISKLASTKDGREYLNDAYRLTQTEADENIEI